MNSITSFKSNNVCLVKCNFLCFCLDCIPPTCNILKILRNLSLEYVCSSLSGVTSNVVVESDETDISPYTSESDLSEEESSDTCNVSVDSSGPTDCSCPCCSASSDSSSVPFQPLQRQVSQKKQGKQTRAFHHKWFQDHSWLSYCVTCDKAFCHVCRLAVNKALMGMPKKRGHHVFIIDGFLNWNKAKYSFKKHERSQLHKEATMKVILNQLSVATQLSRQTEKYHKQDMLMKVLESIKFLVRQGLPLNGHSDEESNLIQLLKCRATDHWIGSGKYLSHEEVTNETMAHHLPHNLLVNIRKAKLLALISDETLMRYYWS